MVGVEGCEQPAKETVVKYMDDKVYNVSYVVDIKGSYFLHMMWNCQHIPGSPFHVIV